MKCCSLVVDFETFDEMYAPVAMYVAFETLLEHHVVAFAPPEFDGITGCLIPCWAVVDLYSP